MNRKEMIRRLVSHSVATALREPQSYWLEELFEKGFAGYGNFSDSRLKRELALRGLDTAHEEYEEEYDEEDDEVIMPEDLRESISDYAIHASEPE